MLECWIENEWNSFSSDRWEFAVSQILIRRPQNDDRVDLQQA
jgi:hypothetical protein